MSPAPIAKNRIELEKAFAHDVFRQTPKEVLDEFGPMVLERVFPELQIDDKYLQFLIESGEDYSFISNVTQESIPISQLNDHWIFPGGVQISKSTGAIYFPKKSRSNKNIYMSILESRFDDLVNVVDMDTIKHPKDRLIMKVTIKTNTTAELETSDGMSLMFAKEEKITTLVFESPEPEPSKLDDAFVVIETSGESKLPDPMLGKGHSIKERLHEQIGHLTKDDGITNSDHLLERFNPVLISQDLVIFEDTNPDSEYKYVAFAKLKENQEKEEEPKHFWQHKKIKKDSNVPAEKTKWLAGLEKKNHKGGFLSGFNTAALTV